MKKISIGLLSLLVITATSACNRTTKIEKEVVVPQSETTVTETTVDNNSVKTEVRTDDVKVTTEVK